MRDIHIFKPQFNKEEQSQITALSTNIWDNLKELSEPLELNGEVLFLRRSIKVVRKNGGVYDVLDTSAEPFQPIYNRFLLKLICENIMEDYVAGDYPITDL